MSTFRTPPDDRPPPSRFGSELESSPRAPSGNADDVAPLSSRFERLGSSGPLSTRGSGTFAAVGAPTRSPQTGSFPAAAAAPAATAAAPPSRATRGGIYQLTKFLEKKHGAFFISRLILASGINLRGFDSDTLDDPTIVMKFIKTVRNMLSPTDMAEVLTQAPSFLNHK